MAFRRRRRFKPRLQWMPPLGTERTAEPPVQFQDWPAYQHDCNVVAAGSDPTVVVQALTWDYPPEEQIVLASGIPSLADWEQSSWRLRRIVGKLFVGNASDQSSNPCAFIVAGFIVLKVNADDGTPLKAPDVTSYDPATVGSNRDPWIWRRSWLIGNGQTIQAGAGSGQLVESHGLRGLPAHNVQYGSVLDGPHVDAKTNRIIGPEERLFLCLSIQGICITAEQNQVQCYWLLDYRLLGSTMKATNRRNASR